MLQVLITIDTEASPILHDWKADQLQRDMDRDIYGNINVGKSGSANGYERLQRST